MKTRAVFFPFVQRHNAPWYLPTTPFAKAAVAYADGKISYTEYMAAVHARNAAAAK